jgi:hypothetical protein
MKDLSEYHGNNFGRPGTKAEITGQKENIAGRWPANLVLVHSELCNGACVEGCPVARLGAQSGESDAKRAPRGAVNVGTFGGTIEELGGKNRDRIDNGAERGHDDSGTAARYFYAADWMLDRLEAADPVAYFPKASTSEREAGLDPRQTALMRMLDEDAADFDPQETHTVYSGDRHTVAQCPIHGDSRGPNAVYTCGCPVERRAQFDPYQRGETTRRNIHPTLKPLSLTRYLATLLLPPAAYGPRRMLIPFAGVASEYIGAMLAGWEEITGVELEAEHVPIANARIAYWKQRAWELSDPDRKPTVTAASPVPAGQLDMFMEDSHD